MKKGYCTICAIEDQLVKQDIESRLSYMSLRKLQEYLRKYYVLDVSYQTIRRHKSHLSKERKVEDKKPYNPYYVRTANPLGKSYNINEEWEEMKKYFQH